METLTELKTALASHDVDSTVDPDAISVLWVPIPQTRSVTEMVHVNSVYYVWEEQYWPTRDPHALAAKLTQHIRDYPPSRPDTTRWGGHDGQ